MPRGRPDDPYVYPGTNVLKNHFDIRQAEPLAEVETAATFVRLRDLQREPVKGSFDITHYANTHHAIFRDVYPFAGEFRTVDITKWNDERQDVTVFVPAQLVVPWLNRHLHEEVGKKNYLRDLGRDEFVERAARLYLDLNALHPFREGNGRTQREFVRTLGLNAGYHIDWNRLDKDELLRATVNGAFDKKDLSLREQFSRAVVDARQDLALQRAWDGYASGSRETPLPEERRTPRQKTVDTARTAQVQQHTSSGEELEARWRRALEDELANVRRQRARVSERAGLQVDRARERLRRHENTRPREHGRSTLPARGRRVEAQLASWTAEHDLLERRLDQVVKRARAGKQHIRDSVLAERRAERHEPDLVRRLREYRACKRQRAAEQKTPELEAGQRRHPEREFDRER